MHRHWPSFSASGCHRSLAAGTAFGKVLKRGGHVMLAHAVGVLDVDGRGPRHNAHGARLGALECDGAARRLSAGLPSLSVLASTSHAGTRYSIFATNQNVGGTVSPPVYPAHQ